MTENDFDIINQIREIYNSRVLINCTDCKYCMPCPVGVNIPGNFKLFNDANIFGSLTNSQYQYNVQYQEDGQASNCIESHQCEGKCPQNILISQKLKLVEKLLRVDKKFESFHWNY